MYGLNITKLVIAVTKPHAIVLTHAYFGYCDNRHTEIADNVLICHNLVLPTYTIPGVSNTVCHFILYGPLTNLISITEHGTAQCFMVCVI